MRFVEYIYNEGTGPYGIDLGYRPTTATTMDVRGMPYVDGNLWIGTGPEGASYGQWFRLFTYQDNIITFDSPEDSSWRGEEGYDGSAEYEDFSCGFNTDGDIYVATTAGTQTIPMYDYDLTAFDGVNNSTLKCWGDGNYYTYGTAKFYEISIYEAGQLVRHYLPAVDSVWDSEELIYKTVAGLYEEIEQQFYGKVAGSPDISWQEKPIIEYSGGTNVVFDASGGSFSARLQVNENLSAETYHWAVKQLTDTTAGSACTISYNGQSGLTEFSGKTDGVFDFDYVMEPWDGTISGSPSDSRYRTAIFHITIYDDATGEPAGFEDNIQRLRQKNALIQGKPVYLGEDQVNVIYLGGDSVSSAYLGEDLVFSAGAAPTPPTPSATTRRIEITNIPYPSICPADMTNGQVDVSIFDSDQTSLFFMLGYNDPSDPSSYYEDVVDNTSAMTTFVWDDTNRTLTIEGPMLNDTEMQIGYFDCVSQCDVINDSTIYPFSAAGAASAFTMQFPAPYTDPECDCYAQGGEWDAENEQCIFPEPDPCEGYSSQEECDCVNNGGIWVVPEIGDPYCEYPEPDECGGDPQCECERDGGFWDGTDCIH